MAKKKGGCLKAFLIFILIIILLIVALVAAALFTPLKTIAKIGPVESVLAEQGIDMETYGDLRLYDVLKLIRSLEEEPQVEHVDVPTEEDEQSFEEKNIIDEDGNLITEAGVQYELTQNEVAILMQRMINERGFTVNGCLITSNKIGFSFTLNLDEIGVDTSSLPDFASIHNPIMYFEYDAVISNGDLILTNGTAEISGMDTSISTLIVNAALNSLDENLDSLGYKIGQAINNIGEMVSITDGKVTFIGK